MKPHTNSAQFLLAGVLVAAMPFAGQAQEREPRASVLRGEIPPELRALAEQGLKLQGPRVLFDGKFNFPPKLKGFAAESGLQLDIKPSRRLPVADAREKFRAVAVSHPRVKELLGERFALLSSGWLDPDKDQDERAEANSDRYQLVFYNYSRNQVVTAVTTSTGELVDATARTVKVQPAESHEEVQAAADIVRAHPRHGPATKGLRARGIQTEGRGDHRFLYLTFYQENSKRAAYEATVDMTAGKIVAARPVRISK
ncbi:MAG: hypothetical protein RL341_2624 [Pseudomonadota bacterium]|jgi:hypothetical protein